MGEDTGLILGKLEFGPERKGTRISLPEAVRRSKEILAETERELAAERAAEAQRLMCQECDDLRAEIAQLRARVAEMEPGAEAWAAVERYKLLVNWDGDSGEWEVLSGNPYDHCKVSHGETPIAAVMALAAKLEGEK